MRNLNEIKDTLRNQKQYLFSKYGVNSIAVFGSYTKGEQREDSDIDILVDFNKPLGIEFIYLAAELENILKMKVDLVSRNGVKPKYMEIINKNLDYV